MLTLILVRHAKSDWTNGTLTDHDRPLNSRGFSDAPAMAQALEKLNLAPKIILSSTATRAKQTADFFADALKIEINEDPQLYLASPTALLNAATKSGAKSLLIVAHNPGISTLAEKFAPQISHMPTTAITVLQWDTDDWNVATSIPPTRVDFLTPDSISR